MPTLVIGAGAWGTAVAAHLAGRSPAGTVMLWGRDAAQMQQMAQSRENKKYLPAIMLPSQLEVLADQAYAYTQWRKRSEQHREQHPQAPVHGLVILATPMSGLGSAAQSMQQHLGAPLSGEGLVWLAKGLALQFAAGEQSAPLLRWPHE
ncbi:MAG: FAD-dependent oxidoreductase, partial [Burkholderiaceae bacterium]|nr:FAD-dependent oxidoreductase [Burkholderiaceae bacterium]